MGEFLFDTVNIWLNGKAYTCRNVGYLFEIFATDSLGDASVSRLLWGLHRDSNKEAISEIITTKEMCVVIELNYGKEIATAHRL
jgi:hypothetical protein